MSPLFIKVVIIAELVVSSGRTVELPLTLTCGNGPKKHFQSFLSCLKSGFMRDWQSLARRAEAGLRVLKSDCKLNRNYGYLQNRVG
jgi:hypothetical protein